MSNSAFSKLSLEQLESMEQFILDNDHLFKTSVVETFKAELTKKRELAKQRGLAGNSTSILGGYKKKSRNSRKMKKRMSRRGGTYKKPENM